MPIHKTGGGAPPRIPTQTPAQPSVTPAVDQGQVAQNPSAAPADGFGTGGTSTGAAPAGQGTALPRSGWNDQAALRTAVQRARETLDGEVAAAGAVNFRAAAGSVDDGIGFPRIMPMYGVPVPDELRAIPEDQGLKKAFEGLLADGVIDEVEAKKLVKAADDGAGLTQVERQDLQRILDHIPHTLTENALIIIDDALKSTADGLSLQSGAIRDALRGMMADFKVSAPEARRLVAAAVDENNGMTDKLTPSQVQDLETIMSSLRMTTWAQKVLASAIQDAKEPDPIVIDPPIMPMYGVAVPDLSAPLKDRQLRAIWEEAWSDRYIDLADAEKLIKSAKDMGGLSAREKEDLGQILAEVGMFVAPDAHDKLTTFLGTAPDEIDIGPIITPMYGVPAPDLPPVDIDPIVRPMYGMPVDVVPTDPVIRPMYGMPVGILGDG